MKFRLDVLLPLLCIGYIAFFPLSSGEISHYFIKSYILLPFVLIIIALTTLSFGSKQLMAIFTASQVLLVDTPAKTILQNKTLQGAITYSYVAALLWVLYILVISPNLNENFTVNGLIPDIALAITYAFVVAELFLRPLQRRLDFLKT